MSHFWDGFEKTAEVLADYSAEPPPPRDSDAVASCGPRLDDLTLAEDRGKYGSAFWDGFSKEALDKKDLKIIQGGGHTTPGRAVLQGIKGGGRSAKKKFLIGMLAGGAVVGAAHAVKRHREKRREAQG